MGVKQQENPNHSKNESSPADIGALRLTNDFLFKRVFGSRQTQDVLLAFVNAVLSDADMPTAVELRVTNPELPKDASWPRPADLLVAAVDSSGRSFDVEVQVAHRPPFAERSLAYWSRLYVGQVRPGNGLSKLRPVVCINIVEHTLFPRLPLAHSHFRVTEKDDRKKVLSDHLSIHFLELDKEIAAESSLGRWMRYIRGEGVMDDKEMESLLQDKAIRRAHEEYQKVIDDPEERRWAWARQVYQMDRTGQSNSTASRR